jgi:5-methylcytosine-specific restriction endonuclease McrA
MFIRKKKVKGIYYYYECESYREGGKIKQRVIRYLGKNKYHPLHPRKFTKDCDTKMEVVEKRKKYINQRYISKVLRHAVYDRDGFKCVYCGGIDNLCIDHKIPVSRGGTRDIDNLVTSCQGCNLEKHNFRLSEERIFYPIINRAKLIIFET